MRSIALARLELDGYLLLVEQVGALEDDAKGALANLLADAVVNADDVGGGAAARHGGWGGRVRVQQLGQRVVDAGEVAVR